MKPKKSPKARLPSILTRQAVEARRKEEARQNLCDTALAYAHVFITSGIATARNYDCPIMPEEEDRRLGNLIDAACYYEEVFYPAKA